jgi:L-fuconolactonase
MERTMMPTIDSHQHFWKSAAQEQPWRTDAHAALERDFEPADLVAELDDAGVDFTVVMQSVDEPAENDRLAAYAEHPRVAGVVGWIPIRDPRAVEAELARTVVPKLRGVRALISDDPLEWLTSPDSLAMFRDLAGQGLAWDVVPITTAQTRQVIELARAVPELRMVVDHLGRPPIDSAGWEPWATNLGELSELPGVAVKVSVGIDALTKWDRWDADGLDRYIAHVCEKFGPSRLMLASNWPVVLLRASYGQAWRDLGRLVARHLPDPEQQAEVSGGTADRWYGLGLEALIASE